MKLDGFFHSHLLFQFRELLHTKKRQDETLEQLHAVLGESCISCELQLAGPEYECLQGISSPSPEVAKELFGYELSDKEIRSQALSPDMSKLKKASVTVDNSLSPGHTLLQIHCADHKGLLYDIMRTLKDCNIQVWIYIFRQDYFDRLHFNSNLLWGYSNVSVWILGIPELGWPSSHVVLLYAEIHDLVCYN